MKHTQPHSRRDFQRQAKRPSVDGFVRSRPAADYERRSSGMLPGNESEYMISLGSQASRRGQTSSNQISFTETINLKITSVLSKISWNNLRLNQSLLAIIGISFMLLFVGLNLAKTGSPVTANKDGAQSLTNNGDTPYESLPYNQEGYVVAPDLAKRLTIQKLGVGARVVRLSVRENSEPKFPQNINDVGWYENSAKPGQDGAALLIGHIRGETKQGVFHDLTNLVPGDEFQIELGDGSIKHYYIVKMEAYERNNVDYSALTQTIMPGKPGLNLLTAVGAFESNAQVVQQLGVFAVEKSTSIN